MQVPSDAEMLLSTIKMERKAQLAIPPLPSTFAADVAAITGAHPASTSLQPHFNNVQKPKHNGRS